MFAPTKHIIFDEHFWISPYRALFWEGEQCLIVSDLHFGKTGHFRKNGIPVPQTIYRKDLQKFVDLLQYFQPKQVIAVGDLFHSKANLELDLFLKWRADFPALSFTLVEGNHDILSAAFYEKADIQVKRNCWEYNDRFCFVHDQSDIKKPDPARFYFSGHIHPGIKIEGLARQKIMLPCFYHSGNSMILPAFSEFTGLHGITPKRNDHIFAIVENKILPLKNNAESSL